MFVAVVLAVVCRFALAVLPSSLVPPLHLRLDGRLVQRLEDPCRANPLECCTSFFAPLDFRVVPSLPLPAVAAAMTMRRFAQRGSEIWYCERIGALVQRDGSCHYPCRI